MEQQDRPMTDFFAAILDMRSGAIASDINNKFNEVVSGVLDTGLKGKFTLKLNLIPSKMGMGGVVVEVDAEHECKIEVPELKVGSARFFVSQRGTLTRNHPDQEEMELAEEIAEAGNVR